MLGLAAAVAWGFFSALGRKWNVEPITAMLVYYLGGIIPAFIWFSVAWPSFLLPTWQEFGCIAYVGVLSNCVGVILWFKALRVSNATLVGNITYSAAFLSVLVLRLTVNSPIRPSALVGLGLITIGVLLAGNFGRVRRPTTPPEQSVAKIPH